MLSVAFKSLRLTFPRSTAAARSMTSSGGGGGNAQRMFQLKTDPLTGKSEWVVIEDQEVEEEDIGHQTTPKALLATTSYLDMLNDSRRNCAYRAAIDKTVTKPCHVLDIGYFNSNFIMYINLGLSELHRFLQYCFHLTWSQCY